MVAENQIRTIRMYLAGIALGIAFVGFLMCARWISEGTMSLFWIALPLFLVLAFGAAFIIECFKQLFHGSRFGGVVLGMLLTLLLFFAYRVAVDTNQSGDFEASPVNTPWSDYGARSCKSEKI